MPCSPGMLLLMLTLVFLQQCAAFQLLLLMVYYLRLMLLKSFPVLPFPLPHVGTIQHDL